MTKSSHNYQKIRRRLIDRGIRLFSLATSYSAYQRSARKRCQIINSVAYLPGGGYAHQLDIYRPLHSALPRPVIMYIHGGGFTMCSKDTHQGIALAYADHGYVVFNVNYRLSPRHRYPAALEDVAAAYQWILANADRFGGNPEKLVIAGESAGGNLTLALAAGSCFQINEPVAKFIRSLGHVPSSIMVLCGMLQVSDPHRLKNLCPRINPISRKLNASIARDVSRAYLGAGYRKFRPERMLADPLNVLESNLPLDRLFPETYAMVGTHDILLDDTRRLENALNERSVPNKTSYFPGQGHAFHLVGTGRQALLFWRENLAFLARTL